MTDYFDNPRNKTVRKSNDLIQHSRFDLTLNQQKIILYLISQISPYDKDFQTYQFSIPEFCRVCGIEMSGNNYNELKKHLKAVADKSAWIYSPTNPEKEILFRWISTANIVKGSGILEIRLSEELKPYLLQLRENYTQYDLIFTLSFKCKYSIRLYELIKSIHFDERKPYIKTYNLDEIKILLGAEKYNVYNEFRRFCLTPAIEEINRNTDKTISFTPIKHGKKVVGIQLTVETKDLVDRANIRVLAEKILDKQITFFDEGIMK